MPLSRTRTSSVLLGLVLWAGTAAADPSVLVADLTRDASLIVIGQVTRTEAFAKGQLFVHTLAVEEVLKGESPEALRVVEERRSSLRSHWTGQRVLAFLVDAPTHSFYREQLPPGAYLSAVGGQHGVIELAAAADAEARAIIASYAGGTELPADDGAVLRRELRSGHPRFAADAAAQLEAGPERTASFTDADFDAVDACLRDPRIDDATKAQLVRLLGARRVPGATARLQAFEPASGSLLAARAEALAELGLPPDPAEVEAYLEHPDADVRRFAVARLAASPNPEDLDRLEAVALRDEDEAVRVAAVEALGETGHAEVAQILGRTFESSDPALRRASARALHRLGRQASQSTLRALVLSGSDYEVQARALVLLFALGATRDDPAIRHLHSEHPDVRIRRLIERGIQRPAVPRHPG
jgi:hypothetical protein